ncbi:MAG TPA: hypothetical protein VGI90_18380 [Steroidobacteraceae bacterium]
MGAIRPGMIGAALNQDVSWVHDGLTLFENRHQLALQQNRVVDGVGGVHAGMARMTGIVLRVGK